MRYRIYYCERPFTGWVVIDTHDDFIVGFPFDTAELAYQKAKEMNGE